VQPAAGAVALVRSGRLRALAVLSEERLSTLPDVPTAHEAGLPNHVFNGGVCLWAPAATPLPVLTRLNGALAQAQREPAVRDRFQTLGSDPTPLGVEATRRFVAEFAAQGDRLRSEVLGPAR
jgi:tripartite-type tricarboxylate transporter receptor subunit TctC